MHNNVSRFLYFSVYLLLLFYGFLLMFVSYKYFCIKSTEKKKNLVALISHLLPNGDILLNVYV